MKIQVAIVSDQVLANLIPALMDQPEKVYLVCSPAMAERQLDRRLARLLKRQAIATEFRLDAPDTSLRDIHEFALKLAADIETAHPGAEVVLNATGGTKLMALGFVEVFREAAQRVIYTDTAHRAIQILSDSRGRAAAPQPMTSVLDVPLYLEAQGFTLKAVVSDDAGWRERAEARSAAAEFLAQNAERNQSFVGALNGLASAVLDDSGESLVAPRQSFRDSPRGWWAKTLGKLSGWGLLQWQEGSKDIDFIDVERTRFLNGGWLEEYAWQAIRDAKPHDVRLGVKGHWHGASSIPNEFDVLAAQQNELLFLECKTLRHHDREGEYNDNDVAYKVDSLGQDVRGLFGETWLLSARAPTDVLRQRARRASIRLIGPGELQHLSDLVRAWVGRGP
jgi:hypothetical protein